MPQDLTATKETTLALNRREFLVTSLVAGFALAVQPIQAQTQIITDTNGLTAGEVKIPVNGGEIPAYRAMPATGKNFPTILVIQEIFGVHEYIKDVCRRFAKLGHCAIAPALYARQGDVTVLKEYKDILAIVSKVPDSQVMSDLDATVAFAQNNGGNTKKLAITGFCWGGRIVWLYAAHNPKVKAGVAWYGRLLASANSPKSELQPTMPADIAPKLKVPVLGLYGGLDKGISQESVEKMRAELAKGKSKSQIIVYPNADHGFHADYRPSYNKEAAEDAFKRANDWLKVNKAA
ncbi:MAG: dienelactone hydrolase family protein [Pyrinomonadaceae bacterium]|nr:dienelactone hydrolase family protein [Pyrinomonadaceae bacterium]